MIARRSSFVGDDHDRVALDAKASLRRGLVLEHERVLLARVEGMHVVPVEAELVQLVALEGEAVVLQLLDLALEPLTVVELDPVVLIGSWCGRALVLGRCRCGDQAHECNNDGDTISQDNHEGQLPHHSGGSITQDTGPGQVFREMWMS
jgi:hypothetical protein